jgi:hypothetical protein
MTQEGELRFDFSEAIASEKLDAPGKPLPEGMQLVDVVVEENERLLLIEVKDPSARPRGDNPQAIEALKKERIAFLKKLRDDSLISKELTPKARDSYTFLHLMGRDDKPMRFVFLLGAAEMKLEPALLLGFKDRLLARLRKETDQAWTRAYVTDCLVLTEATWAMAFPKYALTRVP